MLKCAFNCVFDAVVCLHCTQSMNNRKVHLGHGRLHEKMFTFLMRSLNESKELKCGS